MRTTRAGDFRREGLRFYPFNEINYPIKQCQPSLSSQLFALLPLFFLQVCYGMTSGFPAILTPQLFEACSEFRITLDQESWIVSMDNVVTPVMCILGGTLQQKTGPKMVTEKNPLTFFCS